MTKYAGKKPYPFKPGDDKTGQCSDCGEVFYGERAFDRHRRDAGDDRVCIDPGNPPLRKDGTPERWSRDSRDRWRLGTAEDRAAVAARLRTGTQHRGGQDSARVPARPGVPGTPHPGAAIGGAV